MQDLIKPIAPALSAALDGPFAGVAMKFLRDNLAEGQTMEPGSAEKQITEILSDSKMLSKLKEVDAEFRKEMSDLNVDVFDLVKGKKKSGRQASGPWEENRMLLSILFIVAYFAILFSIFYVEVSDTLNMQPGENSLQGELQILLGVITAGVGQILSYWFGGIVGSRKQSTGN